ncbi:MAG: helix-turn-helix transcriptional regulator [Acidobacteriia bacterium]|nr:helix-turn-helix transcriptional regulator [Terriglobia bacterium]
MDVSLLIRHRLKELGLEQKDLAAAAQVTESYISQLLAGKKAPPAPGRTDIYEKIGRALRLPAGELSNLADMQRKEELRKKAAEPPRPLFKECRELILRKCNPARQKELRRIFEKEPFGELERLVTQKLLDVAQGVAKEELRSEAWLHRMAQHTGRTYEQMRVAILEFLDTDVFNVSVENCASFLDPVIDSWDIDLKTFGMEVVPNRRLAAASLKRFEFAEQEPQQPCAVEPGLAQFLQNTSLSGDATEEEIEFLKALKFKGKQPSPIYYYRELQNLRDPLHFPPAAQPEASEDRSRTPGSKEMLHEKNF